MGNKCRLAVDIGGTFTDIALERGEGSLVTAKVLTTPRAPEEGVIAGVAEALGKANVQAEEVGVIIHGTTLATNALIEKRGAKTALITTQGHRDSLEMAYENRFEQYDVNIDRPPPLVPRWLRLPVRERMNAAGEIVLPLDERSIDALVPVLEKQGVESLAIGLLHSYANPAHEARIAEIIARAAPSLSICLSSEVAPEIREYERQTTTVANAYVRPLMERYLRALEEAFGARGFNCPFLLVTSGGGLCTVETAARFPIRLVESGPAGGAVLAASIAKDLSLASVLSFDMGGTTAKMCLIDDYEPASARVFEVDRSYRFKKGSGMPVRIPVIELVEIGAGGGSIAHVDALKRIQVGPESAGAEPGPACYGRGGDRPAITDADVALGKITPEKFAGGAIPLNDAAAVRAMEQSVGAPLGMSAEAAAFGVAEIVDENMAGAARAHAIEQGKDASARAMIAFGGAAPLHAARLAEKLGLEKIVIPPGAGVGSAIGFLLAPASYEIVRSLPMRLDAFDGAKVGALLAALREEAKSVVRAAAGDVDIHESRHAYMRYLGQGYEIAVPMPDLGLNTSQTTKPDHPRASGDPENEKDCTPAFAGASGREDAAHKELLKSAFERVYSNLYGRIIPGMGIEILSWSLRVSAPTPEKENAPASTERKTIKAQSTRDVFEAGSEKRIPFGVFDRDALQPGDEVEGPALIIETQTTTVVSSSFNAHIEGSGGIILEKRSGE